MRSKHKKILIISLILVVGISVPLAVAHAVPAVIIAGAMSVISGIVSSVGKAALGMAKELGLIAGKLMIALPVSTLVLGFANGFLNWAASSDLVKVGVTDNDFVTAGWRVVRDFVNLFFILIMIAIGIATALRVKGYEIKKILPRLILIALLINFTPVICGVLIDASEIIMDFFFRAGREGFTGVLGLSGQSTSSLGTTLLHAITHADEIFSGELVFRTIALIVFNCVASFVLITLGLLFLVRHVVLWTLVILSPLAFFSYILPATKKVWNMWWEQFIKWSFIGVGAAFFLYLAQIMMKEMTRLMKTPPGLAMGLDSGLASLIITQSIPLIFLVIGMFITTSTSAMGASQVINLTKKGTKWARSKSWIPLSGANLKQQWSRTGRRIAEPFKEKLGAWATRVGGEPAKRWKGAPGEDTAGRERARVGMPYYWARQRIAGKVLKGTTETEVKEVRKLIEEYKKLTSEGRTLEARTAATNVERIAATLAKMEERETDDLTKEEVLKAVERAGDVHKDLAKEINRATPQIAIKTAEALHKEASKAEDEGKSGKAERIMRKIERMDLLLTPEDIKKGYKTLGDKLAGEISPKKIPSVSAEAFKNKEFLAGIMKFWGGNKAAVAGRELGRTATDEMQKGIDEIGAKLETENLSLYKFSKGNAGARIGLGEADSARAKANELIRIKAGEPTLAEARSKAESNQEKYSKLSKRIKEKRKAKKGKAPKGEGRQPGPEEVGEPEARERGGRGRREPGAEER